MVKITGTYSTSLFSSSPFRITSYPWHTSSPSLTPEKPAWCTRKVESPGICNGKLSLSLLTNFQLLTICSKWSVVVGNDDGNMHHSATV